MQTLNQSELDYFTDELNQSLVGARLQSIMSWEEGLILEHFAAIPQAPALASMPGDFAKATSQFLLMDLSPAKPMVLLRRQSWPCKKRSKPFPIALFLNSHAKNLYFRQARVMSDLGRVLELTYQGAQSQVKLTLILIPRQGNLKVECGEKKIWYAKPKEISPLITATTTTTATASSPHAVVSAEQDVRTFPLMIREWLETRGFSSPATPGVMVSTKNSRDQASDAEKNFSLATNLLEQERKRLEKILLKKEGALLAVREQLQSNESEVWLQLGERLKLEGFSQLTTEDLHRLGVLAKSKAVGVAIEHCFAKSKQLRLKIAGTEAREKILLEEIREIRERILSGSLEHMREGVGGNANAPSAVRFKSSSKGEEVSLKTRKLELAENVFAYIGKSAIDNLSLLRQARSWDFWLHLKDYPGAYGIIRREKNQKLSPKTFEDVAHFVVKNSTAVRSVSMGDRLAVVIAECKFVRPIKGDKAGRVTYSQAKEITVNISK